MDNTLKADIADYYYDEYYAAASAKTPGLLGAFTRWADKKEAQWQKYQLNFDVGAPLVTGLAVGFAVSVFTAGLVVPVIAAAGAAIALSTTRGFCELDVRSSAVKALDQDIENGKLTTRYKTEVVEEQLQELVHNETELKSKLSELDVKPAFAEAVKNAPASPAPAAKPAAAPMALIIA